MAQEAIHAYNVYAVTDHPQWTTLNLNRAIGRTCQPYCLLPEPGRRNLQLHCLHPENLVATKDRERMKTMQLTATGSINMTAPFAKAENRHDQDPILGLEQALRRQIRTATPCATVGLDSSNELDA